jgi:hypothetical protein
MKKICLMTALILLISFGAYAANVYTCGFEPAEQSSAFVIDQLVNQGTPSWKHFFYQTPSPNYTDPGDRSGFVVEEENFKDPGTQAAHIAGYTTNYLTLDSNTCAPWFGFAFKPNFDRSFPTSDANDGKRKVWMHTLKRTKSVVSYRDANGIQLTLVEGGSKIMIGTQQIGTFTNNKWHTISFRHNISGGKYTGSFEVFLNGVSKGTFSSIGPSYNVLQTIVFSAAAGSDKTEANANLRLMGDWFIDDIYIGDTPVYNSVPTDCSTLIKLGLNSKGDLNSDCNVNIKDFALFAKDWMTQPDYQKDADNIYNCNFEASEGFSTTTVGPHGIAGEIENQGNPVWDNRPYSGSVDGGWVTTGPAQPYSGSQYFAVSGRRSNCVDLNAQYVTNWVEFAYRTNFDVSGGLQMAGMFICRGPLGNYIALDVLFLSDTSDVVIDDIDSSLYGRTGYKKIGSFQNGQWGTISLCQEIVPSNWWMLVIDSEGVTLRYYQSGRVKVYLNGQYAGLANVGQHGTAVETLCFSSAFFTSFGTSYNSGSIAIDNIHVGDRSVFVTPTCDDIQNAGQGLAADFNKDCEVDLIDLDVLATDWLQ